MLAIEEKVEANAEADAEEEAGYPAEEVEAASTLHVDEAVARIVANAAVEATNTAEPEEQAELVERL